MARIGTVGYLNARPLSDRVDIDRHTLVMAHPAEVARMLAAGEVDVALVPVAAVLGVPDYRVVPGFCIGAEGPVGSVLIAAETAPELWTKVVLDGVSRTSVVLARLLLAQGPLAERVRPGLELVPVAPGAALAQAKKGVAALLIGDAARAVPERLGVRVDLATAWREWTGLPFVFAVWAGRKDLDPEVVRHLAAAGRDGVAAIRGSYAGEELRYLTENLRYPLDDAALMGLRRFAALAARAGWVAGEDFELYPPPERLERPDTDALLARALEGGALPVGDVVALLRHARVADLAAAADLRRRERFPGDEVPYRLDAVLPAGASVASVATAIAAGASRIRLTGPLDADRVRAVAEAWPGVARQGGGPSDGDPAPLAQAGLGWVAEETAGTLSDRVRAGLGHAPASAWLAWAEKAARAGLAIAATVAVGQGETDEELAAHLLRLRDLPGLREVTVWAADGAVGTTANTATDHVRAVAVARLVLPGHVRLLASPETEGLGMAEVCLRLGCDHAGAIALAGDPAGWPRVIAGLERHVGEARFRATRAQRGRAEA